MTDTDPDGGGGISALPDSLQVAIVEDMTPGQAVISGLASITLAIFAAGTQSVAALGDAMAGLIARAEALGRFITALFEEPIPILRAGADATIEWILTAQLGPFSWGAAIFAIAVGWWVWQIMGAPIPIFGRLVDRFRS